MKLVHTNEDHLPVYQVYDKHILENSEGTRSLYTAFNQTFKCTACICWLARLQIKFFRVCTYRRSAWTEANSKSEPPSIFQVSDIEINKSKTEGKNESSSICVEICGHSLRPAVNSLLLYRILYSNYLIIKSYSMQVNLHVVVYDFAYKIIHEISCQWELAGRCNDPRINLTVKLSNPDLCTGTQSQKTNMAEQYVYWCMMWLCVWESCP